MTYIPQSIRRIDALSLSELCNPRFTLRDPTKLFGMFGGVVDTPDVTAERRHKQQEAREIAKTCPFPGCARPVSHRSRTKTCRDHRHSACCQCLNCRKVMR